MNPEPNYFKVNRSLLNSERWLSETFTRGQAWVDLFGLAQHKNTYFRIRGIRVEVQRGQLAYSELTLSKRWGWSRNKTRKFLKELENDGNIEQQKNNLTTIISIVKYDFWQGDEEKKVQQKVHQKDTRRTPEGTHTTNDNKYIDNKLSISVGNTPSNGNAEINLILEEFKKRIGRIPADKYERRVAQHVRLLINGFIKRNGVVFLKLRGRELTLGYVLEKSWDWYMKKEYAPSTEKLEAYKLRLKVFLDLHETRLKQEGGDLYGIK